MIGGLTYYKKRRLTYYLNGILPFTARGAGGLKGSAHAADPLYKNIRICYGKPYIFIVSIFFRESAKHVIPKCPDVAKILPVMFENFDFRAPSDIFSKPSQTNSKAPLRYSQTLPKTYNSSKGIQT